MQSGLEQLYRIRTPVDVCDYVIDDATRGVLSNQGACGPSSGEAQRASRGRLPREQLLVSGSGDDLELALFVSEAALANLVANDPGEQLDAHNLPDFLLALEGVSHFVCVVWRAQNGRPVSALELEMQAEVDKYVTCLLLAWHVLGGPPVGLHDRIFREFALDDALSPAERERYREANARAAAYAASLEMRYVRRRALPSMLAELRRFYRLGWAEKVEHIAQAA